MNKTIKGLNIDYVIDEENKIVICRLKDCKYIAINRISKHLKDIHVSIDTMTTDTYYINNVFTGVARCSKEDTWDEEYGKKLALLRARKKRALAINGTIDRFVSKMENALNNIKSKASHVPDVYEEAKIINKNYWRL